MRSSLVCTGALCDRAKAIALGDELRLGHGEESGGGRERASILADAFEAVIGAIYLDGGEDEARKFIKRFVFDAEKGGEWSVTDYKTTLQEIVQKNHEEVLSYRLKSESGCKESGMPCICDDSGLVVDALDGAPGVYSARYAGDHGNDPANIALLLENMKDVPDEKRTARFMCTVCCSYPDGSEIVVSGTCEGKIGYEPKGNGGFGYDPVFMVGDKSFAELTAEEKDKISHRGNALKALAEALAKRG